MHVVFGFFFQAEDGIRDGTVTGVQTCALPIFGRGQNLGAIALRLGAQPLAFGGALGAHLPGLRGVCRLHARVYGVDDLVGRIDALDAGVYHLDAEAIGDGLDPRHHGRRQAAEWLGNNRGHRQLRIDRLELAAHRIAKPRDYRLLIARTRAQVGTRITHAPAQVDVNHQSLLILGKEGFTRQTLAEHSSIHPLDVFEWPAPVQARRVITLLHLPEAGAHGELGLADREHAQQQQQQQPGHGHQRRKQMSVHWRSPRSRLRSSRGVESPDTAAGALGVCAGATTGAGAGAPTAPAAPLITPVTPAPLSAAPSPSLSSGNTSVLPPLPSTMILRERARMVSMVSIYNRLRVT